MLCGWHDAELSAVASEKQMTPRNLRSHKKAEKQFPTDPVFKSLKRGKLPRPFARLGGPRIHSTGMVDVSKDHVAMMYWRDGEIMTDRSFYGHLFCRLASGSLSPIYEFHWHPSHKGFHCKTPCATVSNYTDRTLPGAPELGIKTQVDADPKNPLHLKQLVEIFCKTCGISLPNPPAEAPSESLPLWP